MPEQTQPPTVGAQESCRIFKCSVELISLFTINKSFAIVLTIIKI